MIDYDFYFEVPKNRNLRALLLTDPQIIDSANKRRPDRLTETENEQWSSDTKEKNCYRYIRELVGKTDPDVILMCGDFVYGEFDDEGKVMAEMIDFMDSLDVPYATCLGNHERDSKIGADKQCRMLENGKNSFFKKGNLSGQGNFSIAIMNGNDPVRILLFLDSQPFGSGDKTGFAPDQVEWVENICKNVTRNKIPVSLFYHAQMKAIRKSLEKYGFPSIKNFELKGYDGEFGYIGASLKSGWDKDYELFYHFKDLGVDSHFFGHEHCNSAGTIVDGVRMQYVLKSSTYDRCNYLEPDGSITQSYIVKEKPIIGGTYLEIGSDSGKIEALNHVYCDTIQNLSEEKNMHCKHKIPKTLQEQAVIQRARQLTDFKWTPLCDVPSFTKKDGNMVLPAGKEITGFPYSSTELTDKFLTENVSIESFLSAIPNPYSKLYQAGRGAFNSCSFGIVCNGLARYAYGIKRRVSTMKWLTIPGMKCIAKKGEFCANDIELCDCLWATNDGHNHVALITDLVLNELDEVVKIEVSEGTRPLCIRKLYTVEEFFKKFEVFSLCRYDYLEQVPLIDEYTSDLLKSGMEKLTPKISVDNGNKSNYLEGEEVIIYASVSDNDVIEIFCNGKLIEEIKILNRVIIPKDFNRGYYKLNLRNAGESVEFCVNKAEISYTVENNKIIVKADPCDESSKILYMDFRISGYKVASLSKYEELTEEEKESGLFAREIPDDAENFKVYFVNKYGVWVHRMTKIERP